METLWQDVKYGIRMLAKAPGFTAVAVLTLALGIGVNTAMFGILDATLLRPLPAHRPEELVTVETRTQEGGLHSDFSFPLFSALRELDADALEIFAFADDTFGASAGETTERVRGEYVSANYFSTLGVRPVAGAAFTTADEKSGAQPAVVISHSLWQRFFAGNRDVLGKTLRINNLPFEVVGVAPRNFRGMVRGRPSELWITMPHYGRIGGQSDILTANNTSWMLLAGRLKPGVTPAQAQAIMTARLPEGFAEARGAGAWSVVVTPAATGSTFVLDAAEKPLLLLFGAVGLVLLIACANVANLLLARAQARRKEVGIRIALGASRARLVRQLLTESVMLALVGGAMGLLLAMWTTDLAEVVRASAGIDLQLGLDGRVLGFTLTVCLATAILFGIMPAFRASRVDVVPVLKDAAGTASRRGRLPSMRDLLVVGQVTLAVVLLVGAGLFLQSLMRLQGVDMGFRAEQVLAMSLDLELQGYDAARGHEFYAKLGERVSAIPGVRTVSLASALPATAGGRRMQSPPNFTRPPVNEPISIDIVTVTPRFFETLGLPLQRGRDFRAHDAGSAAPVIIVNGTMATKFWPGGDPVGQTFFDGGRTFEVVGVAKNTKYRNLRESPRMTMYMPLAQSYRQSMNLLVQTSDEPGNLAPVVRQQVRALDSNLPVFAIRTLPEHISQSLFLERMQGIFLGVFGSLALVLAAVGLYGVMAYTVARRTRELGIRMALGAQRNDVLRLVVGHGLRLVVAGVLLGVMGALALTRVVQSLLYGVSASDPATIAAAALALVGVALAACLVPARRATRVDPMVALRYE
jgi:predicted permease